MTIKNIFFIDNQVQDKDDLIRAIDSSDKWYVIDSSLIWFMVIAEMIAC